MSWSSHDFIFAKSSYFKLSLVVFLSNVAFYKASAQDVESCCIHGQTYAMGDANTCEGASIPYGIGEDIRQACVASVKSCCEKHLREKLECNGGMKLADMNLCSLLTSDISLKCCYECFLGQLDGAAGRPCGDIAQDTNATLALTKNAYHTCCKKAAALQIPSCKSMSCQHSCTEQGGRGRCECQEGFRLQPDNTTCTDINECIENIHNCSKDQNCINKEGGFECTCKKGFEMNSFGHCVESATYESVYACEGKTLNIDCGEGALIKLIRANYGRFSMTKCNKLGTTSLNINCLSTRSMRVVHNRCHMKQSCDVLASSETFGDPCPDTEKYLEAHYQCIEAPVTTTTSESSVPSWFVTEHTS